jgi:hypothetical protein
MCESNKNIERASEREMGKISIRLTAISYSRCSLSVCRYHYWLLYRLPEYPDPEVPPGNQLIAPVGKFFRIFALLFMRLTHDTAAACHMVLCLANLLSDLGYLFIRV